MRATPLDSQHASTGRRRVSILLLACFAVGLIACGDDDNAATPQAFCDQARELDQQPQFPSDDQLQDLKDAAPDPIAHDVELVADALAARGESAFGEPDVEAAIAAIETYEGDVCGLEGNNASEEDADALSDLTPNPDHPYCDVEDQIDGIYEEAASGSSDQGDAIGDASRRVVDEGLLEAGRTLVPDDLREDFEALASAVEDAASGDLVPITSGGIETAGRRVDYFCGRID